MYNLLSTKTEILQKSLLSVLVKLVLFLHFICNPMSEYFNNSILLTSGDSPKAECSFSKRSLIPDNSSRKKKCEKRSIKCPECSTVINLQNWFESQTESMKGNLLILFYSERI